MTKNILYFCICTTLIFAFACRKDNTFTEIEMEPNLPIITVEAALQGIVMDLDGSTIEGAHLTLGNSQTISDENGYFKLTGLTDSKNAIVKVEMAGYFDAWHAFQYFRDDMSQTKIRLCPRTNPSIISANNGGEIQFENTSINFQAGSFIDESGNPYTGEVSIYTFYLDPTDPELHTFMPGNLSAFDANNRLQLLETYGMINVELEGDAGQSLQINQAATIEMAIPNSILNRAPSTIPLWYFDTEQNRWVEEGTATLQGNKYIGTVNHFTFWNCDVPVDLINLSGQAIIGDAGANLKVCITNISNGDQKCTTTSTVDGYFGGFVPAEQALLLEIFAECNTVVHSENIGPFNDDATVGPYIIELNQSWAFIHGNAIDCDGNPLNNGYVLGTWGNGVNEIFNLNANGEYSKYINSCNASEITLRAMDLENIKSSDPATFALTSNVDGGTLEACDNDFIVGIFIEYGTSSYSITTNVSVDVTSISGSSGAGVQYKFSAQDDQGDGNIVEYEITIINWENSSPTHSIGPQMWLGPSPFYFVCDDGDVNFNFTSSTPGDIVDIELTNAEIYTFEGINADQSTYFGGNFRIVGIVQ